MEQNRKLADGSLWVAAPPKEPPHAAMLREVRVTVRASMAKLAGMLGPQVASALDGGKMLRSALAARLWHAGGANDGAAFPACCAATELIHTATLLHDDVLDGASIRRGAAALWRQIGTSEAVLAGDMLLCQALDLLAGVEDGRWVGPFVRIVRETCQAEIEQDIHLPRRQAPLDEATCLRLAREKTGGLFAFPARAAARTEEQAAAFEVVGYCLGTIYQLADDLVDACGTEADCGKTLGSDRSLRRPTLMLLPDGEDKIHAAIERLYDNIVGELSPWPECLAAFRDFLRQDVLPQLSGLGLEDYFSVHST